MGSRANYIVTANCLHEIYYSHWGAQHIDRDFFFGPPIALDLIRTLERTDDLLDTVWAEGGAIVDMDAQRLKLWGGEDMLYDVRLRQLWLQMLAISWAGWEVSWADYGMIDIADHLAVPRQQVRPTTPILDGPTEPEVLPRNRFVDTLLSAATSDTVQDLLLPAVPSYYLAAGPSLLAKLAPQPSQSIPHENEHWPHCCVCLALPTRTMWVCSPQFGVTDPQFANELAERWPDWTIHLHNGGVPRHLDLTGRDATPLLRPVADHIKSLAQIVQCGDSDPGHLADLLRRSLPNGIREIRVNPNVYQRHNFDLPQSDRMDAFLSILSRWQSLHAEAL